MIYDRSLLSIYLEHTGECEYPAEFMEFCLYSLVAASVGDRVGFRYMPEAMTIPAIYVFLVGPSGYGKNETIGIAKKFASALPAVPMYEGRLSGPMLLRIIEDEQKKCLPEDPTPKLWLITPELSFTLGEGPKAMDFIKAATELYSLGGRNTTIKDSTLTYGQAMVTKPCLNWLAGTTTKWLKRSVSLDDIEAGFGSRVLMVYKEPSFSGKRILRPKTPPHYWRLRDEIQARLTRLTELKGEFRQTTEAAQVEEMWYQHRPEPTSEHMAAWWKREVENCLKMAMILSLTERDDLIITDIHMAKAQEIIGYCGRQLDLLINTAGLVQDHTGLDFVRRTIMRMEVLPHEALQRMAGRSGITSSRLTEVLRSLVEAGQVRAHDKNMNVIPGSWKGRFYTWCMSRTAMPAMDHHEEDGED